MVILPTLLRMQTQPQISDILVHAVISTLHELKRTMLAGGLLGDDLEVYDRAENCRRPYEDLIQASESNLTIHT